MLDNFVMKKLEMNKKLRIVQKVVIVTKEQEFLGMSKKIVEIQLQEIPINVQPALNARRIISVL
jgi:hypothetical protein